MRPRGTQNGSQNREKCYMGPIMLPRNYKNCVLPMLTTPWGGFLAPPGNPKIYQKLYFRGKWWKMGFPGQSFFRFLLRRALQPTFSSIFHRFLTKKSMSCSLFFFQPPWLFLGHGDLHDSMVFSNRNLLFHFLLFCFFLQKMIKNQCKKTD